MDQFENVLTPPLGMHYTLSGVNDGKQILRLKPNLSAQEAEVFFTKITEEDRDTVKSWLKGREAKTACEERFLTIVEEALQVIQFPYWIANIEPAVDGERIYFAKGEKVGIKYSCGQWQKMAENFVPQRGSRLSTHYELFVWYALRIANGLWNLEYVANDSTKGGNYWHAPDSSRSLECTGFRTTGGFYDGQGNTCKIVNYKNMFAVAGCDYSDDCNNFPVANLVTLSTPSHLLKYATGVVVLTK